MSFKTIFSDPALKIFFSNKHGIHSAFHAAFSTWRHQHQKGQPVGSVLSPIFDLVSALMCVSINHLELMNGGILTRFKTRGHGYPHDRPGIPA